jgi:hypothetical protein
VCIAVAFCVLFAAGILGGRLVGGRDLAGERRAIDARASELMARALVPGSTLACLDATASEFIEGPCEKALFATPAAAAAAVSYVTSQLALLAAGKEHLKGAGGASAPALMQLRRNVEVDRFGIAAHVLSVRDGCTAARCDAFALLNDPSRVSANLAHHAFDATVQRYALAWAEGPEVTTVASAQRPAVSQAPGPAPVAGAKPPSNYFFPSSASIPAVSIMNPEPATASSDAGNAPDAAPSRKVRSAAAGSKSNTVVEANANATRTPAPMQLAPNSR